MEIFESYDLVLDCTDTPASRYLISDTCVVLGKPLVSGSALRTDGQLMFFNYPPRLPGDSDGGPCYRCMFPKPPPPESVVSCGEGGILGPVVGVMGVLQALEAIKLITSPQGISGRDQPKTEPKNALLFSAYSSTPFRSFRMCRRRKNCSACSSTAFVTREYLTSGSADYVHWCGTISPLNLLDPTERISVLSLADLRAKESPLLIDTRDPVQFQLCNLENSINIPFSDIDAIHTGNERAEAENAEDPGWLQTLRKQPQDKPMYIVCRLGNDSQLAVQKFKELGLGHGGKRPVLDIKGGLKAWHDQVDQGFPDY